MTEEEFNIEFFGSFEEETQEERAKRINYKTKIPGNVKKETPGMVETDFSAARTFSPTSYKENDAYGKEKFINFITKRGHTVVRDTENYGIDLVTEKDGVKHYFELEVSSLQFTSREDFPYENVSYLGRKKKYTKEAVFNYVIISRTGTATTCNSSEIFKDDQKKVTYCGKGRDGFDELYYVNKNNVKFFKLG